MFKVINYFLSANIILAKLAQDAELQSPEIKIEPADTYIQKAVDLLKKTNPSYFVGVRKIVVAPETAYGHVESGPNADPTVIHINLTKIRSEVESKMTGLPKDQMEKAVINSIAQIIAHERAHVMDYKPESGFHGEGPAETEERNIRSKLDQL